MANNTNYFVDLKLRELENIIARQNIDLMNKDWAAQNTINSLTQQLAAHQHQLQQQHQQINFLTGEHSRMDAELTSVYCTLVKRDRDVKTLTDEVKTLTDKWKEAETELAIKNKRIESLESEKEVLRSHAFRLNDLHKLLSEKDKQFKEKDVLCEQQKTELLLANERITQLQAFVDKMKKELPKKPDDDGVMKMCVVAGVFKPIGKTESGYDSGLTTDESRQGSLSDLMPKCESSAEPACSEDPGLAAYRVEDADEVLPNSMAKPKQGVTRIVTRNKRKKQVAKPKRHYISMLKFAHY